jgi:hypothetical protein
MAAGRCVFDRVVEQVKEDLMQALGVSANGGKLFGNLQ